LPHALERYCDRAAETISAGLGKTLARQNSTSQIISAYLHSAGIENGYGYFAPAIPNSSKVVFELHCEGGRVEYELPEVNSAATGLRLITLLDYIGQTDYEELRRTMVKMLAYSVWERHSDATTIRAVYGYIDEPSLEGAKKGAKESYHFLYAYDFDFRAESPPSSNP
jgi:hypothetical protein